MYTSTARTVVQDASGYAMEFLLHRTDGDANAHVFRKATGGSGITVTGTFNSDPTTNTQRVVVTVEDTDTDGLGPGHYRYVLRRTDSGAEAVLARGVAPLQLSGAR